MNGNCILALGAQNMHDRILISSIEGREMLKESFGFLKGHFEVLWVLLILFNQLPICRIDPLVRVTIAHMGVFSIGDDHAFFSFLHTSFSSFSIGRFIFACDSFFVFFNWLRVLRDSERLPSFLNLSVRPFLTHFSKGFELICRVVEDLCVIVLIDSIDLRVAVRSVGVQTFYLYSHIELRIVLRKHIKFLVQSGEWLR